MSQEKIYFYLEFLDEDEKDHVFIEKESEIERLKGSKIYERLSVWRSDPEQVEAVRKVLGRDIAGENPLYFFHMICNEDCPEDCDGQK